MDVKCYLLLLGLLVSCNEAPMDCVKDAELPEFDYDQVTLLKTDGTALKDSLVNGVRKLREVFSPCRSFIYESTFISSDHEPVIIDEIKITALGLRAPMQEHKQDLVLIEYINDAKNENLFKKHNINLGLKDSEWIDFVHEGIIENEEEVWMHPVRFNQFISNEVAPFPMIKKPLIKDQVWQNSLSGLQGWGDWDGISIASRYEVVNQSIYSNAFNSYGQCWNVRAVSNSVLGENILDFWFSDTFGFVSMKYINHRNQVINMELKSVQ